MERLPPQFRDAYREYDREFTIRKTRLGCFIGIILVPLFSVLDYTVYPEQAGEFLLVRLLCSLLMAALYPILNTDFGRKYYRLQGVVILFLPTVAIGWMIFRDPVGAASPYYAGLNLVLMILAVVLDWTFWQSVACVLLVHLVYLASILPSLSTITRDGFINNLFFLASTGVAIVTGAFFHSRVRVSEFVYRCKLDRSTKELEETNQKLLELDQVKNRFFANISHELRTPLTLLLAPMETLLHRFNLEQPARELVATMHANGMRLLKLINDLLDLVRLESGRMEVKREPVAIDDFIKGLVSAAKQMAEDKGVKLGATVEPALKVLLGDRDKLEKIVLNLLFNALKFTPSGGRVQIRAARAGPVWTLCVEDTGVGISEKNLPFVFDRFWQADGSSKRKYQGVGIGLALVKELTEIQGGKASVKSAEGKGTTFTIELPYEKADVGPRAPVGAPKQTFDAELVRKGTVSSEEWLSNLYRRAELFPATLAKRTQTAPLAQNGKPTVLIADDEPDMLRFLSSQLQGNYHVVAVVNGKEAVEKAAGVLPDIILLDMMMPEKDGLQACREIRENPVTCNIPIVHLTARADEETKLSSLSAGANDFLSKPFSTTELYVRIKNLLDSHQFQQTLARQKTQLEATIEQLKQTESQLVQSEKMRSLGKLSAGIMHEVGNALNFPKTGVYRLRKLSAQIPSEKQSEVQSILGDVEEGLNRVAGIVTDLRKFTHPDVRDLSLVDVNAAATSALRFVAGETEGRVRFEKQVPPNFKVWSNSSLLVHVLINLIQNSLDALDGKKFVNGESPTIWIEGRVEADKSLLVLRDNGTGLAPGVADKIFDPFFTTKDVGEGMGLGLSICYSIVHQSQGRIWVSRTEPGKCTEFTLEFPCTKPEATLPIPP